MPLPLLAGVALPALIDGVRAALDKLAHPVAKGAARALSDVGDLIRRGSISPDEIREANRHLEAMTALEQRERTATLSEINQSLRAEVASADPYVRRMRPTFGYLIAITWAAQMLGIAYVIVTDPKNASPVIDAMASLGTIWTVGLSVLGIYVYQRSEEKKISARADSHRQTIIPVRPNAGATQPTEQTG